MNTLPKQWSVGEVFSYPGATSVTKTFNPHSRMKAGYNIMAGDCNITTLGHISV